MRCAPIVLATALLAGFLPATADDLQDRLDAIAVRLDADEGGAREAAQRDLEAWCEAAGEKAEEILRAALAGKSVEAQARIRERLAWYDLVTQEREFLDGIFRPFDLPDVSKSRFVLFNTGKYTVWESDRKKVLYFTDVRGWILAETAETLTLETTDLEVATFARRVVPPDWPTLKALWDGEGPGPGEYSEDDFEKKCRELADLKEDYIFGVRWLPAINAHWAFQRGWKSLGHEVLATARRIAGRGTWRPGTEKDEPDRRMLTDIAMEFRRKLISDGFGGTPRKDLLAAWTRVAALPGNAVTEEARLAASFYASLLEEDACFAILPLERVAALPEPARVKYWVHALRDVTHTHSSSPGSATILGGDFFWDRENPPNRGGHAAWELVRLGFAAVPALIEHLDDERPTRVLNWHRASIDSVSLLTYATAAKELIEKITGRNVWSLPHEDTRTIEDRDKAVKRAAELWWEEEGSQTEAERMFNLYPTNPSYAVERLLAIDAAEHLPRIKALLAKAPDDHSRTVRLLGPHLTVADREFLISLLKAQDFPTQAAAAELLIDRCDCTEGAPMIAARLKSGEEVHPFDERDRMASGLSILAKSKLDLGVTTVVELLAGENQKQRHEILIAARNFRDCRVAEALFAALEDTTENGWTHGNGFKSRFCDDAAVSLALICRYEPVIDEFPDLAKADAQNKALHAWYSERRELLDWKSLREEARIPGK